MSRSSGKVCVNPNRSTVTETTGSVIPETAMLDGVAGPLVPDAGTAIEEGFEKV